VQNNNLAWLNAATGTFGLRLESISANPVSDWPLWFPYGESARRSGTGW